MADNVSGVTVNLQRPCEEKNIKGSPFYATFFGEEALRCLVASCHEPHLRHWRQLASRLASLRRLASSINKSIPIWEQQEITLYDQTHSGMTDIQTYLKSKSIQDTVADIQRVIPLRCRHNLERSRNLRQCR